VDDVVSDADVTCVASTAADGDYHLDLYNIDASAIPAGSTINSVTVYILCRSIDAVYKAFGNSALKKSGGAVQYGANRIFPSTYTLYSDSFAGLTQVDLDALQIGVRIASTYKPSLDIYRPGRCTQVYVEIDYTPPAIAVIPVGGIVQQAKLQDII
jgi:hypothetical protein